MRRRRGHALRHRYGRAKVQYAERTHLPDSAYALRDRRQLLLTDKHGKVHRGHVLAATARLSMMRNLGHVTSVEYNEAHRHIAAAGREVGLHIAA